MKSWYHTYDNSIELTFHNTADDIEIIELIRTAITGRAKAALEKDDYEATLDHLRDLSKLDEDLTNWKENKDEQCGTDRTDD